VTPYWDNGPVQLYQADARSIPLPDQSVHCVVTSPPYFGLRVYKDNDDRGIGLESTVENYIDNLVDVFREVRRVLRDDGVAWLNLGDSYGDNGDRLGIPERVVLALQSDGWTWRDTIIWAKKSSMPESLAGWRWERCRMKISPEIPRKQKLGAMGMRDHSGETMLGAAQYADCPGCPKCAGNDGLVLRRGSWRTTQAHEYIYMLTKGMGYYADGEAVKTAAAAVSIERMNYGFNTNDRPGKQDVHVDKMGDRWLTNGGANRRSVWNDISPEPYGGAHFATFPSDLPRICIQASTSERGCCSECGSQWARVINLGHNIHPGSSHNHIADDIQGNTQTHHSGIPAGTIMSQRFHAKASTQTLGWRPTCNHNAPAIPATVLDPFSGAATTCRAAQKLGRRAVGVDISESYLEQAVRRLSAVTLPMGI
jgi:SAM-dependent methyltransferase